MTANEYAQIAAALYAQAKDLISKAENHPERGTMILIAFHLQAGAKVAKEAAEAKARSLSEAAI